MIQRDGTGHWFASDLARNWLQLLVLIVAVVSLFLAIVGYNSQQEKRQLDATLEYVKRVQADDFTMALWNLEDFTKCFEDKHGKGLAYRTFADVTEKNKLVESVALAKEWFDYIENDDHLDYCARAGVKRAPLALERDLYIVYGRLEGLASCGVMQVCDLNLIIRDIRHMLCEGLGERAHGRGRVVFHRVRGPKSLLLDSFDWEPVLAISNYLRLSSRAAREWEAEKGNFAMLLERFERWAACDGNLKRRFDSLRRSRRGYEAAATTASRR
jgi:hypothetical protein